MDFHKIAGLTIEDIKKGHIADLAIQEKYGVKYHQFWLNQEAGTLFCLTEGPDMKTCEMVHRLAHGNVACAMIEVESGYYRSFMGEGLSVDDGIVRNADGSPDLGYRSIMVVTAPRLTRTNIPEEFLTMQTPQWARNVISQKINEFDGRLVKGLISDSLIGVFNDATQGIKCARSIQSRVVTNDGQIIFRVGVSVGQPVTESGKFFTDATTLAHRLTSIAMENQILVSSLAKDLCTDDALISESPGVRSLNASEEEFISNLLRLADSQLSSETFTIGNLCHDLGVSRPQLYRKIMALTGRSPLELLTDLRMDRALTLLKKKTRNISEIAFEVGYNSPSYFARCFARKFGCTPSNLAV